MISQLNRSCPGGISNEDQLWKFGLYSQNGWNSPDDAILHHLLLMESVAKDLKYKKRVSYPRLLNTRILTNCYELEKQLGK